MRQVSRCQSREARWLRAYDPLFMENNMHSVGADDVYMGTLLVNGRLCHRWLSGRTLAVLIGREADGDEGGDGDDGDGDEGSDDGDDDGSGDDDPEGDDDGGDDDDDDSKRKPSAKSLNRAHKEAAKFRVQRNQARTERDSFKVKYDAEVAAHAETKKGTNADEQLKAENARLLEENATLKSEGEQRKARDREAAMERQITGELDELDLEADADFVLIKLRKEGLLSDSDIDEDGEIDDLSAKLKKLAKKGIVKKAASGDDDDDDSDKKGRASSGGATRSGRSMSRSNGKKDGLDEAKLRQKYPALNR